MDRLFNVNIKDIIEWEQASPNFNSELIVIKLDGHFEANNGERIQVDAFTLVLVLCGTLDLSINGKDYHITSKVFLDVLDIHAVQNIRQSDDFKGYNIIVSKSFMEETMRGIKRIPISNFMARYNNPVINIDDEQAIILENALVETIRNIHRKDHVFQRDIVKNALRTLFIEVSNIIVQNVKTQEENKYRTREEIVAQFVLLMSKHSREQHSVSFYAQELCVEVKYLSRILKSINGKTTSFWIDQSIVMHAKMLLKEQELTIKQIVDMLHFSDQSAFGKFFKKHCGISPLAYRRS